MTHAFSQNLPVWDDAPWTPRPALEREVETDVCVVGLGGSGLTAVSALQELGAQVVGLEAGTVGGGAAGRNGGFLLAGTASSITTRWRGSDANARTESTG